MNKAKRLLIVVNDPAFFLSHRVGIALAAMKDNYEVHIATAAGEAVEKIKALGLTHHEIHLTRSGLNPISEIRSLGGLYSLFGILKPDLVHLVTIKPVLYGGIIAKLTKVPAVVAAISGLGSVFVAKSIARKLVKYFVIMLYKLALNHKNIKVIFQNETDKKILLNEAVIKPHDTTLIRGSGVDLSLCEVREEPAGEPVVVMAARLLKEKGVITFIEASRILKERKVACNFLLVGTPDPGNPSSVTNEEINSWTEEGLITALGFRTDIPQIFSDSHIVVLPSFYGEGLPKVLIEAAACARAVITTDNPGCREAIEENITGLLIPVKDPVALADAIQTLVDDVDLRKRMGKAGRELAEREFKVENVIEKHLSIYRELIANNE